MMLKLECWQRACLVHGSVRLNCGTFNLVTVFSESVWMLTKFLHPEWQVMHVWMLNSASHKSLHFDSRRSRSVFGDISSCLCFQLLLSIEFTQPVKLHSLKIYGPPGKRIIHLWQNTTLTEINFLFFLFYEQSLFKKKTMKKQKQTYTKCCVIASLWCHCTRLVSRASNMWYFLVLEWI